MDETVSAPTPFLETDWLLKPVEGECRSGAYFRNKPEWDAIGSSLRGASFGGADAATVKYAEVIRSACALLTQSKDLNIAVWLTQALTGEHGLAGLTAGLGLIRQLLEEFWETIHPQIETSGDEGLRAAPLNRLDTAFMAFFEFLPIANGARTMYEYNASRDVPRESQTSNSTMASKRRSQLLEDGVPSPEVIDAAIEATEPAFYIALLKDLDDVRRELGNLKACSDARFLIRDKPTFNRLGDRLTGFRNTISAILGKKPAPPKAPEPEPTSVSEPPPPPVPAVSPPPVETSPLEASPESAHAHPAPLTGIEAIFAHARAVRADSPSNPLPYMLVRALQFGRLLETGRLQDDELPAPPTDIRVALRRAWLQEDWSELLTQTELAMELACGGCWLDLQYYAWRALAATGQAAAARAVRSILSGYLCELPELIEAILIDGAPAASKETKLWITKEFSNRLQRDESTCDAPPAADPAAPDTFHVAQSEVKAGRPAEGIRLLREAALQERSGREKLLRQIQLAKICMETGHNHVALPLLREVYRVIEDRKLDQWEDPEWIAPPLAMLYQCLTTLNHPEERGQVYGKLCLIDPNRGVELSS